MNELSKLPNIGKSLEQQLLQSGIETPQQLKEIGSKQAWLDIKAIDPSACYNRLCSLEGAIQGVRWHDLNDETKKDLKGFYNDFKACLL
ncbi:MAG: TfoX/Sxy family protein [Oscillospiraceae bacterium]